MMGVRNLVSSHSSGGVVPSPGTRPPLGYLRKESRLGDRRPVVLAVGAVAHDHEVEAGDHVDVLAVVAACRERVRGETPAGTSSHH